MGKLIAGRIFSAIIAAGGWLVAGLRLALDLIGYSTVPDDLKVAQDRLKQAIDYFFAIPWWGPLGFATIASLWLMHVSWPRHQSAVAPSPQSSSVPVPTERPVVTDTPPAKATVHSAETHEDRQAKNELGAFAMNYLLPACEIQRALQNAIIRSLSGRASVIESLARKGLAADGPNPDYERHRKAVAKIVEGGRVSAPLADLVKHIHALSSLYPAYCLQPKYLCHNTDFDYKHNETTSDIFIRWMAANIDVEERFREFTRDVRFPELVNLNPKPGQSFLVEH